MTAPEIAGPASVVPTTRPGTGGNKLLRFIIVRFLLIFPTIFILVTLVFVLMRTRNPCVFFRRRVFGWNVRLPFMTPFRRQPSEKNRQCYRTISEGVNALEVVLQSPAFPLL